MTELDKEKRIEELEDQICDLDEEYGHLADQIERTEINIRRLKEDLSIIKATQTDEAL